MKKSLIWKVPLSVIGVLCGILLLLLIAVATVMYAPSIRHKAVERGVELANQRTDYDVHVGNAYLSPFHQSPAMVYRAYRGKSDLPVIVEFDSLFIGHRGSDTLICLRTLRLHATALTAGHSFSSSPIPPIRVDGLLLEQATFHSDSLIAAVGIDAIVGHLQAHSPELLIAKGQYPLHGLRLNDADIAIALRQKSDTTDSDTTSVPMAFYVPDGEMNNIRFRLLPLGLDIRARHLSTDVSADVGANCYDARRLQVGGFVFAINELHIPADTIYGNALVDLAASRIFSDGLHVRSRELGATLDLAATRMNLQTMQIRVSGLASFQGSHAELDALYDIDDQSYDASVHLSRVNLSAFSSTLAPLHLSGDIRAVGQGINPQSPTMDARVDIDLPELVYGAYNLSGLKLNAALANLEASGNLSLPVHIQDSALQLRARTFHQFKVANFFTPKNMRVDYHARFRDIRTRVGDYACASDSLRLDFATDSATALSLALPAISAHVSTPLPLFTFLDYLSPLLHTATDSATIHAITSLENLTVMDTIRQLIPPIRADIALRHGSPVQSIIEEKGLDINHILLSLNSDTASTDLALNLSLPHIDHPDDSAAIRLPAIVAQAQVKMRQAETNLEFTARSHLTDGAMNIYSLCTDADVNLYLNRHANSLQGKGRLSLDSLTYNDITLGSRSVDLLLSPSSVYEHALRADVRLDDIPLDMVAQIVQLPDIALNGTIKAGATVDGLPHKTDISAQVQPIGVSALYEPYSIAIGLGETPITMVHNHVDLNGLPIYGADSTFIALYGGLDVDSMLLNVTLAADSFAPVKLPKDGPLPVYGDLATNIRGTISGPLDSIQANIDLTLLPTTDITYPIDKKNLAQVKPHGTVNARYAVANKQLALGGRINVDEGRVRYSPKLYPVMPFRVDSGSHVAFNGPLGSTMLNVSASQNVKSVVQSEGEETRRVDFNIGVRVNGMLDSIGLNSIGFFLEAPDDEVITRELESLDEETREGLAATLLATGMYVGQSNVAVEQSNYALSSIVSSRINAALANSKMGKFVDIDLSTGQTEHAAGKTNDVNIGVSKSFFQDKLRITLGASIFDNPENNKVGGLYANLSAEYKLTPSGNVLLRAFAQRDFNNIFEGELYKSGIGVRAIQQWQRMQSYRSDSIERTYSLTTDADIAYRSNNSIGPNLTIASSIRNLLGKGETFTLKANGAYYWALRDRHPGDPKRTDTYKLGATASLVFPYLHWAGDNNPDGDTRYMLGYQYENIAGGFDVHKLSGSLTYFIKPSPYITHAFTPFSLSIVQTNADTVGLVTKTPTFPQLVKLFAKDELVPAIGYTFTYNDYRAKQSVNSMFEVSIKESGNIINAIYCAFGNPWSSTNKSIGNYTFNQFVKLTAELRNRYNFPYQITLATRLYAGANIPVGNSTGSPLSESFYSGGPNSVRAAAPYAYGPGNFNSSKYNQNFFHAGDCKLEANIELRFPIVWKLFGAAFVDAGNVWNWYNTSDVLKELGYDDYTTALELAEPLKDGIIGNSDFAKQIALGTGAGLRLDIDGLVVRLDLGVGLHAPFQTYRYDKDGKVDTSQPITSYFNMPSALDALRLNFGIGYPF